MRRGYTLIEMLITVAIASALLMVTWPSGRAFQGWWLRMSCLSNLAKLSAAKDAYIIDFGGGGTVLNGGHAVAESGLFRVYFVGAYPEACPAGGGEYSGVLDLGTKSACPLHGAGNQSIR